MTTPATTAPPNSGKTPLVRPVSDHPGRGRKPGTVAKERAAIPADEFKLIELTDKVKGDRRRKREERTPQQKNVDQIVYDIFNKNVSTGLDRGTIADWADLSVYDWPITKSHAETAEFMIVKACRLYNRRPIWGERIEVLASKSHMITGPDGENMSCHLNGTEHVHISFSVVRKRHKMPKS